MSELEKTLRVLVVEDEEPARLLLREYLAELPGAELAGECANGFEAVKKVAELAPDVLLLDVRMPKLDGFEVLELLGPAAPAVIFTTAYDEYALRAFEVHAVDYLRKPFTVERLAEALERVRRSPGRLPGRETAGRETAGRETVRRETANLGRELGKTARRGAFLERVLVRDGAQIHVLPCERIDYVEAQDDEIVLVAGKERWRKAERLGDLESALDPGRFVRIHRSYLLNVDRIARLELYAKDSRIAILRDGSRLPVSRAGFQRLRELL